MKQSYPALRTRLGILASAAIVLALTGCSGPDPVPGAQPAKAGEVQFTSDAGLITINVPASWKDETSAMQEVVAFPGMRCEAVLILDGTLFVDASSMVIVTYENAESVSTAEFASQTFEMARTIYPTSEVVLRETLETT
ncbi:MAG: hypothetical protein MUP36_02415, partial [Demequinaceae bacterium]|nr:hypothetical protein [Demequinaceae bacterium]